MQPPSNDVFHVGTWLVQPRLNRIGSDGQSTRVEPKVMHVLLCLAEKPGEVASRDDLLKTVWAGTIVTDDVLTRAIAKLRKAFADDPRHPTVVETIPKTGYRLIAPVTHDIGGDTSALVAVLDPPMPAVQQQGVSRRFHAHPWAWVAFVAALVLVGLVWFSPPSSPSSPWQRVRPVTSYQGNETLATLSPDGNQVAFVWDRATGNEYDLYVKWIGTEEPLRLTHDPVMEGSPTWSPDGGQIAFMRHTEEACTIFVVSVLGGPERKLADCGLNLYPDLAWSPDGQWLAYSERSRADKTFGIVLLSINTLAKRTLTTTPATHFGDHDPTFSPDGQMVAFTRGISIEQQDVYTIPLEGGEPTRLTFGNRILIGHDWTPDGQYIVFSSNRNGRFVLWRVPAMGGTPEWVALEDKNMFLPSLSRQQQRLTYVHGAITINIWGVDLSTLHPTPQRLIASTQWDLHPQLAPNGERIAFISNRSGSFEVWVSDRQGEHRIKITAFDGAYTSTPRWAPDSRHLVFTTGVEGQAEVFIADADGGIPQRLTHDDAADLSPSWSQDGAWVYFSSNRSGTWQIWKRPAAGGTAQQVTMEGGYTAFESPDGRDLYFARRDKPGIWRMPVDGGQATLVLETVGPFNWSNWIVREDGIYFIQTQPNGSVLTYHNLATQHTTSLFTLAMPMAGMMPEFSLSHDGTWMLFAQADASESDIMLAETERVGGEGEQ